MTWFDSVFHFNDYNRDKFIANVARSIPPGSKVLDAGAGTCKYKPLFAHCEYKAQDLLNTKGKSINMGDSTIFGT